MAAARDWLWELGPCAAWATAPGALAAAAGAMLPCHCHLQNRWLQAARSAGPLGIAKSPGLPHFDDRCYHRRRYLPHEHQRPTPQVDGFQAVHLQLRVPGHVFAFVAAPGCCRRLQRLRQGAVCAPARRRNLPGGCPARACCPMKGSRLWYVTRESYISVAGYEMLSGTMRPGAQGTLSHGATCGSLLSGGAIPAGIWRSRWGSKVPMRLPESSSCGPCI